MSRERTRAHVRSLALAAVAWCACATPGAAVPDGRSRPAPPRADTPAAARRGAATGAAPATAAATADGRVTVELREVQNARGQLLVALFRSARGFPDRGAGAFGRTVGEARAGTVVVTFEHVPPGAFAVSAHHDEDGDFEMDTGLFGIPAEGYGFSRDARAAFGPPDFGAARLTLAAGQHRRVPIRMNY
jgi:uncharacterized protein (DUF2141 family)